MKKGKSSAEAKAILFSDDNDNNNQKSTQSSAQKSTQSISKQKEEELKEKPLNQSVDTVKSSAAAMRRSQGAG